MATREEIDAVYAELFPGRTATPQRSDGIGYGEEFTRAIQGSAIGTAATATGAGSLALNLPVIRGLPGAGSLRRRLAETHQYLSRAAEAKAPTVGSISEAFTSPEHLARFAIFATGSAVPSIAESVITGLAGALIGSAAQPGGGTIAGGVGGVLAKGAAKKLIKAGVERALSKEVAEELGEFAAGKLGNRVLSEGAQAALSQEVKRRGAILGSAAAGGLNSFILNTGETYNELRAEGVPEPEARNKALVFGLLKAAPDTVLPAYIVGKFFPGARSVTKEAAEEAQSYFGRFLKTLGGETPKTALIEGGTEAFQEYLDVAASKFARGESPTDLNRRDLDRIGTAGAIGLAGGIIAGPLAAAGQVQKPSTTEISDATTQRQEPVSSQQQRPGTAQQLQAQGEDRQRAAQIQETRPQDSRRDRAQEGGPQPKVLTIPAIPPPSPSPAPAQPALARPQTETLQSVLQGGRTPQAAPVSPADQPQQAPVAAPEPISVLEGAPRIGIAPRTGLSPDGVRQAILPLQRAFNYEATVVGSESELPTEVQAEVQSRGIAGRVQGFHQGGQAYLNASAISSPREARQVFLHEVIGHRGLADVSVDEWAGLYQLLQQDAPTLVAQETEKLGKIADQRRVAQEVIARFAETDGAENVSLWQKIISYFRRVFGRLIGQPVAPSYVRSLLRRSAEATRRGGTSPSVPSEISFSLARAADILEEVQGGGETADAADAIQAATENVLREQAGESIAQLPQVEGTVSDIIDIVNQRNLQGDIRLTGENLNRLRIIQRLAAHPIVREFLITPLLQLRRTAEQLGRAAFNYDSLRAEPNVTPEVKSGAALVTLNRIQDFEAQAAAGDAKYEQERASLVARIDEALERGAEQEGQAAALRELLNDLREFGEQLISTTADRATIQAYRRVLGRGEAVRNVLQFIGAELSNAVETIRQGGVDAVRGEQSRLEWFMDQIRARQNTVANLRNINFDQAIGASQDVVEDVARIVLLSEPLQQRLIEASDFLGETATALPTSTIKARLAQEIKSGNTRAALRLFVDGVGDTEARRRDSAKAARFYQAEIRRRLIELQALDEAKQLLDNIRDSQDYRQLKARVYGDANVRRVIDTTTGKVWELEPISGETPTQILFSADGGLNAENLTRLREYADRAIAYLSDDTAEGYDPARGAALQAFLTNADWYLNPAMNPAAGRFTEGLLRKIPRTIWGWIGQPDLVPKFVLDLLGGFLPLRAQRSLLSVTTVMEAKTAIENRYRSRRALAVKRALESHGLGVSQVEEWRVKVWRPLAASLQQFENIRRLGVGSNIGNGYTVTAEDMEHFKVVREYERAVQDLITGVGERAFRAIQQDPTLIIYEVGGQKFMRSPLESGPGTVHRRFSNELDTLNMRWRTGNRDQRISLLNEEAARILFGYIKDSENTAYAFPYAYRAELVAILKQARDGDPIRSFEDLVARLTAERNKNPDVDPVTPEIVSNAVLGEINQMFDSYNQYSNTKRENEKAVTTTFGGDNSFQTARGNQVVPSLWYDYGLVTLQDEVSYLHTATAAFMVEHEHAIAALDVALKNAVDDRTRTMATLTAKARQAGEQFYTYAELERVSKQITLYRQRLEAAMQSAERPKIARGIRGGFEGIHPSVIMQYLVGTLLTGPKALTVNAAGAFLRVAHFEAVMRGQSFLWSMLRNAASAGRRMPAEVLRLLAHDSTPHGQAIVTLIRQNRQWLSPITAGFADYFLKLRDATELAGTLGISMNTDLLNTLRTNKAFWQTGGFVSEEHDADALGRQVMRFAETLLRGGATLLRQGFMGFVDARANVTAVMMAQDMEADLKSRAKRVMPAREEVARKEGRDPFSLTDPKNRISDVELVGGRLATPRAQRLRQLLLQDAGVDVDLAFMRFYQRWIEAGRPDDISQVPFFTDAEHNQFIQAISQDINQATFSNRPILARTSGILAKLSLFLGYPAWAMYKISSLVDPYVRNARGNQVQRRLETLPLLFGLAMTMAIIGAIGAGVGEELSRRIMLRVSPFPTIFEKQTPLSYAKTVLNGFAGMFPFYGYFINQAIGRVYRTGFDFSNMFVLVNIATDAFRTAREMLQTGAVVVPGLRFLGRYVAPFNWVTPRLPVTSGLNEMAQTRNLLRKGAASLGLEAKLAQPAGVGEMQFGPMTPLLNEFVNAVGNRDFAGATDAYVKMLGVRAQTGDPNPQQSVLRAIQSRHPMNAVFSAKPTEFEVSQILANLPQNQRNQLQSSLQFYDTVVQGLGGGGTRAVASPATLLGGGGLRRTLPGGAVRRGLRHAFLGVPGLRVTRRRGVGVRRPSLRVRATVRRPRLRRGRVRVGLRRPRLRGRLRRALRV